MLGIPWKAFCLPRETGTRHSCDMTPDKPADFLGKTRLKRNYSANKGGKIPYNTR